MTFKEAIEYLNSGYEITREYKSYGKHYQKYYKLERNLFLFWRKHLHIRSYNYTDYEKIEGKITNFSEDDYLATNWKVVKKDFIIDKNNKIKLLIGENDYKK